MLRPDKHEENAVIYRFDNPDPDAEGVLYRSYPLSAEEWAIALERGLEAPTPLAQVPELDLPGPAAHLWRALRQAHLPWTLQLRMTEAEAEPRPVTELRVRGLDDGGWDSWVWVGPTLGSKPRISLKRAHILAREAAARLAA